MAKNFTALEHTIQKQLGFWLAIILVGITGYLIGSQHPQTASTTQSSNPPTESSSSIIDSIQAATTHVPTNSSSLLPATTANSAPTISAAVNINTASAAELDTLPGIGPAYAKAVIDYRNAHGPFVRAEDIQQVKGIGPKTYEKLKDKITI